MKSNKTKMVEGIELPNQESIRTLEEKETNKYFRNIGRGHHQISGGEIKNIKEYLRRTMELFKTKLQSRILISAISY